MELPTHAVGCGQFTGHCETSLWLSITLPYLSEGRGPGDIMKISNIFSTPSLLTSPSPFNTHQPPRHVKLTVHLRGLTCQFSWSGWPWRCVQGVSSPAHGLAAQRGAEPLARSPAGTAPGAGRASRAGRPASPPSTSGAPLEVERGEAYQGRNKRAHLPPTKSLSPCPCRPPGHLLLRTSLLLS